MSWYVGKDGAHLWIKRDETVFTVIQPADSLPVESLTYLALNSRKAAYQEHLINDDAGDVKNNSKRRRDKQAGRQRGYVVRIEQEEQLRVVPWFKAAALKLIDDQVVSRVDADEAANSKSKKKNNKPANVSSVSLGVNECRVETSSRIHHFAHGPGFSVEVCEGSVHQKIHFFTNRKELSGSEWHSHLVAAVESMGAHVMLARRTNEEATQEDLQSKAAAGLIERVRLLAKDNAQKEDDAWLDSVMNAKAEASASSEEDSSADEEPPKKPEPAVTNTKGAEENAPTRRTTEAAKTAGETLEWRRREPNATAKQQPHRQSQQSAKQQSKSKQEQPAKWQPSSIQQLLRQQMLQKQPSGVPPPRQHEPPIEQQQPPLQQQSATRPHQQPSRHQPQQHQQHLQQQEYHQRDQPPRHREMPSLQQPHSWEQQWWQRGEDERQDWQQQQHWWHASDHRHEEDQRWQPPVRQEEQQRRHLSVRPEEEQRWQPSVSQEDQQRWQPSTRLAPERPAPQRQEQPIYHASAASGSIVDQLFARARIEEKPPVPIERERSDQATACGECGRGRPLKLFMDPDDSQWYCRMCWVDFYGKEPPGK